ncbi:MAG: co-activator of prophage gene expression [Phage 5P_3]|nr:MAG: co-activator of prophage gene expression [Phage 5P_3]
MAEKRYLGVDVLTATRQRIAWTFDTFERVYVSFSGGKDSTVMTHLVMEEAVRRGRKVGLLFVDFEAQYRLTIEHIQMMYDLYAAHIEPYWVALPIHLRNAVSMYEHHWVCWEPDRRADWVRDLPTLAISDQNHFPFYHYAMEFEEFVPNFGSWFGGGQLTACLVGIRTAESLNRWRTIAGHGSKWEGRGWTNYILNNVWNVYPIYDWSAEDLWAYHGKTGKPYNALYDRMYQAGLTIHQMRICQPYGDDQRKGLWLFHIIEPETWARVVARVNGANSGALYAQESGNILGRIKISKPEGHTWESFAMLLLESLPPRTQEHFRNKIAVFLHWWASRGYMGGIPDEVDPKEEAEHKAPSWRRICKALLKNDYWCKSLSFSQHTSRAYTRYLEIMKRRRAKWGIL